MDYSRGMNAVLQPQAPEIDLSGKYQGYKKELYGDAVQALYTELK